MIKWYDILPYKKGDDDINGIKALLDHVGNFVIVIHRGDSGEVGISIGARKEMSTAITMLDGMEVMVRDLFDFVGVQKIQALQAQAALRDSRYPAGTLTWSRCTAYWIERCPIDGFPGSQRKKDGIDVQGILVHTLHGKRAVAGSHVGRNVDGVHAVKDKEHISNAAEPHPKRKDEDIPGDTPVLMRDHLRRH